MNKIEINLPEDIDKAAELKIGDIAVISGVIYTARDAAHKLICEAIENKREFPIDLKTTCLYYCGPTPARDGEIIGSCGPTTSSRMDDYTPLLMRNGLKITIGKGKRSKEVKDNIVKYGGAYLALVGGAAALIKNKVTDCQLIAYPELGCEAIYKLTVNNLEAVVWIDSRGNSL